MQTAAPPRSIQRLRQVAMVSATAILIEGVAGALTNAFGPATFSPSPNFWQFDLHWYLGYVVGILVLVLLVLAVRTQRMKLVVLSAVTLLGVASAAAFGMLFVRSSPNIQGYSDAMAVSFVVAFAANVLLSIMIGRELRAAPRTGAGPAASP